MGVTEKVVLLLLGAVPIFASFGLIFLAQTTFEVVTRIGLSVCLTALIAGASFIVVTKPLHPAREEVSESHDT